MRQTFVAVVFFIGVCSTAWAGTPPDTALWNADKSAAVMSITGTTGTRVTAYIRQEGGAFLEVDLSQVEDTNFGKLGRPPNEYDYHETQPIEWLPRKDGLLQVKIQTRAWKHGKRYTISEPIIFRLDGTILWR